MKLKPISESIIVKFLTPYDFWVSINIILTFIVWPAMTSYCLAMIFAEEFKFHNNSAATEHTRLENIVDYIQRAK